MSVCICLSFKFLTFLVVDGVELAAGEDSKGLLQELNVDPNNFPKVLYLLTVSLKVLFELYFA